MRGLIALLLVLATRLALAEPRVFVCPMHPDLRRATAGACPRCGMPLEAAARDRYEAWPLAVRVDPPEIPARAPLTVHLRVLDPASGAPARELHQVHERRFHLFVISEALDWFEHVHPEPGEEGWLRIAMRLPREGRYQLIGDFFPAGGSPQLVQHALITSGHAAALRDASLRPVPVAEAMVAGMRFSLSTASLPARDLQELTLELRDASGQPVSNLEPYLGATMHALAVSADLRDVVHTHGEQMAPGRIRFELRLPRPGTYRLWVQVQRAGVVQTAAFTVIGLPSSARIPR